jgi:hypothetical protein
MDLAGELRRRLSMLLHRSRFERELDALLLFAGIASGYLPARRGVTG